MVAENKDCALKSKLTKTVKALSKYNGRTRIATKQLKQTNKQTNEQTNKQNIQTNKLRDTKTGKHLSRKTYLLNKKTYLKVHAQTDLQWTHTHTHTQRFKQK